MIGGVAGLPVLPQHHSLSIISQTRANILERITWLKKNIGLLGRAHFEKRKGTYEQALEYDQKDGDFYQFGIPTRSVVGRRKDADARQETFWEKVKSGVPNAELMDYDLAMYSRHRHAITQYNQEHRPALTDGPKELILLVGPPGCGKTKWAFTNFPDLYEAPVTNNASIWFDGYHGETTILYDEFEGSMPLNSTLKLFDLHYIRSAPVKGAYVWLTPERVIVTSNQHPSEWYDFTKRKDKERALRRRFTKVYHGSNLSLLDTPEKIAAWWPITGDAINTPIGIALHPELERPPLVRQDATNNLMDLQGPGWKEL